MGNESAICECCGQWLFKSKQLSILEQAVKLESELTDSAQECERAQQAWSLVDGTLNLPAALIGGLGTPSLLFALGFSNVYVLIAVLVPGVVVAIRNYLTPDEMRVKYNDAKIRFEILRDTVESFQHNRCYAEPSTGVLGDLLKAYMDEKNRIKTIVPPVSFWMQKLINVMRAKN